MRIQERILEKQYRQHIFGSILSGVAAIGNVINQGYADATNRKTAQQNLQFQRENLEYQKQLQQEIFAREDTAHQREINDLRNAGINPLATATGGNGAQAGQVIQTEAMHNDYQQQPVQFDPTAMLTALQQAETKRNNKATEDISRQQIKNERDKIESDETINVLRLEEERLNNERKHLEEMYKLAEQSRNNKEMEKISTMMANNQAQSNRIAEQHYNRMDELSGKQYKLDWENFTKVKLPESEQKLRSAILEDEKLKQQIENIMNDNELKTWQKREKIMETVKGWTLLPGEFMKQGSEVIKNTVGALFDGLKLSWMK